MVDLRCYLLPAAKSTITNLISWFSVFDFTQNIKQAGEVM